MQRLNTFGSFGYTNNYGLFGTSNLYNTYAFGNLNRFNTFSSYYPQLNFSNLLGQLNYPGNFGLNLTRGVFDSYTFGGIYGFNNLGIFYPQMSIHNIYNSAAFRSGFGLPGRSGFFGFGGLYGGTRPSGGENQTPEKPSVLVNIQVDADIRPGEDNAQGLINIMDELDRRGIKTTVFVCADFALQGNQLLINDYYKDGHEIALHGYYTGEALGAMDYTEQKNRLSEARQALEGCLACGTYTPVNGFRPQYFSQDPNTYRILDELGFEYNCGFKVGQDPYIEGHKDDVWPFRMPGHDFCVLPVSKGNYNGSIGYLCDIGMAFGKDMAAGDWGIMLSNSLDRAIAEDEPLVILFHNWFTGLDLAAAEGEPGFWQPFVDFLDEVTAEGGDFVTTQELVDDYCI